MTSKQLHAEKETPLVSEITPRERVLRADLEAVIRAAPLHLYAAHWRFEVQQILQQLDRLRGVRP